MTIALIAAHDKNLVIGKEGDLPWHYPVDLKHFKQTTMGHPIVMGRVTYQELGEKPLPGRPNIVLSRSRSYDEVPTYRSLETALEKLEKQEYEKIFIIGGGEIYREALAIADLLYITQINKAYEGDTYFPEYRDEIGKTWIEVDREDHSEYSFITYKRAS